MQHFISIFMGGSAHGGILSVFFLEEQRAELFYQRTKGFYQRILEYISEQRHFISAFLDLSANRLSLSAFTKNNLPPLGIQSVVRIFLVLCSLNCYRNATQLSLESSL